MIKIKYIKLSIKRIECKSMYLVSDLFRDILDACMWSMYRIDWRMFTHFRERFWESRCLTAEQSLGRSK